MTVDSTHLSTDTHLPPPRVAMRFALEAIRAGDLRYAREVLRCSLDGREPPGGLVCPDCRRRRMERSTTTPRDEEEAS